MLVDTSVLIRTLQVHDPRYEIVATSLQKLPALGHRLCIVPQNLVELWVVATRPVEQNGLGLTPLQTAREIERIKSIFTLLPESPAIFPAWEALVIEHNVSGKPAHDARLVAAMQVHGETRILTFDKTGFSRFPGIQALSPFDLASPPARD